jgi:inorganic pyrophosphatase
MSVAGGKNTTTANVAGLLVDLDGTLYLAGRAIDGVAAALSALRASGMKLLFTTNTSARLPDALSTQLQSLGLTVVPDEIFGPVQAAAAYLAARPDPRALLLVDPAVLPLLDRFSSPGAQADTVVIGDMGDRMTFALLNQAFRRLREGAELVALQKNPFWFAPDGPTIDCGAFVSALEFSSGKTAQVVGKPSPLFFELALRTLGLRAEQVLAVGDDVTTDIAGAVRAGLRSLLVRTGKFSVEALARSEARPTAVVDSFAEVPAWLEGLR